MGEIFSDLNRARAANFAGPGQVLPLPGRFCGAIKAKISVS
jgi:hypothetical protein